MQQLAIIFHKDNANTVAASLNDYSASDLLEEYDWMLNKYPQLVLAKDVLDDGFSCVSYVITVDMFEKNVRPITELNDNTYTFIRTI